MLGAAKCSAVKLGERLTKIRIKKVVALVSKLPPLPSFLPSLLSLWGCRVVGQQEGQTGSL